MSVSLHPPAVVRARPSRSGRPGDRHSEEGPWRQFATRRVATGASCRSRGSRSMWRWRTWTSLRLPVPAHLDVAPCRVAAAGAVRRPAGGRLPARTGRRFRPRGCWRGSRRCRAGTGAHRGRAEAVPGRGRSLRRRAGRRAAIGGAAPPRPVEAEVPARGRIQRRARSCPGPSVGWARYAHGAALIEALRPAAGARGVAGVARGVVGRAAGRGRGGTVAAGAGRC